MESNEAENGKMFFIGPEKRFGPDIPVEGIPALFYCWRFVVNPLDELSNHSGLNVTGAKHIASLAHQMEYSINLLALELRGEGIDAKLELAPDEKWKPGSRYVLRFDGNVIARFDEDFGYDCFDASATAFKDKMREVVLFSLRNRIVDELLEDVFGEA